MKSIVKIFMFSFILSALNGCGSSDEAWQASEVKSSTDHSPRLTAVS
jgi:hypothetical protein